MPGRGYHQVSAHTKMAARPFTRAEAPPANPVAEARALATLVQRGEETTDSIRRLIGDGNLNPYRRKVRILFDALVDPEPQIITLLKAGWSHNRIFTTLHVPLRRVQAVSKRIGAPYLKPHGRGRRLTRELREQIRAALAQGLRSIEIQRKFHVDDRTVTQFRRANGDFENRCHWLKYSAQFMADAEQRLRNGGHWLKTANQLGCSLATLQRRIEYRKYRNGRLTPEQRVQAEQELKAGKTWGAVARQFQCSPMTVQKYVAWRRGKPGPHPREERVAA